MNEILGLLRPWIGPPQTVMAFIILFGCFFFYFSIKFRKNRASLNSTALQIKTELNSRINALRIDFDESVKDIGSKYVNKEAFNDAINNLSQNLTRLESASIRMDDKLQQILFLLAGKKKV